jgi:hypothetical protein
MVGLATASSAGSVTIDATATSGAGTHTDWIVTVDLIEQAARMTPREITGADTVTVADLGKLLYLAGTFTLAYASVTALGEGFWYAFDSVSGTQTHNPDGAETIDGVATIATTTGQRGIVALRDGALVVIAAKGYGTVSPSAASEGTSGIAELATQAETDAVTDDARIVTPLKLGAHLAARGRRNRAINGGFEIWRRGTPWTIAASSATTALVYGPDRWAMHTGANQNCTITRVAGLSDASRFAAKVQRDAGQTGTGLLRFEQAFDLSEIFPFRSERVTVSFTVKGGADYSAAAAALVFKLYTGTGSAARRSAGSYTGEATPISQTITLTGSAVRYSFTTAAPLGASISQLSCAFEVTPVGTAGADDSFSVDDLQIDVASVATPFERLTTGEETRLCKVYWRRWAASANIQLVACGVTTATTLAVILFPLDVPMRTSPTLAVSGFLIASVTANTANPSSPSVEQLTDEFLTVGFTTSGQSAYQACTLLGGGSGGSLTADAEV